MYFNTKINDLFEKNIIVETIPVKPYTVSEKYEYISIRIPRCIAAQITVRIYHDCLFLCPTLPFSFQPSGSVFKADTKYNLTW